MDTKIFFVRQLIDFHGNYMFHWFFDKTRAESLYESIIAGLQPYELQMGLDKEVKLIEYKINKE